MTLYLLLSAMTYGYIIGMYAGAKERPCISFAIFWAVLWPACWVVVACKLYRERRA